MYRIKPLPTVKLSSRGVVSLADVVTIDTGAFTPLLRLKDLRRNKKPRSEAAPTADELAVGELSTETTS